MYFGRGLLTNCLGTGFNWWGLGLIIGTAVIALTTIIVLIINKRKRQLNNPA